MKSAEYPALRVSSAAASRKAQALSMQLVRSELLIVVAAAAVGAVSVLVPSDLSVAVTVLAAVLLLGAMLVRIANRLTHPERTWYDGRAVAESLKSSTWRYMTRAEPFHTPDAAADQQFLNVVDTLLAASKDLPHDLVSAGAQPSQITQRMRAVRATPVQERTEFYRKGRVADQQQWYSVNAVSSRRAATTWFWIGLAAQGLALVLALTRIAAPSIPNAVGVLTSIAAAATAWTQAHQYDELAKRYGVAAQELVTIADRYAAVTDDAPLARFVADAEAAISREHTSWVAKRA